MFNVISGKSADDVYFQAKAQIDDNKRQSTCRRSGYISIEDYLQHRTSEQFHQTSTTHSTSMQNLFSLDNSIDSFSLISQTSTAACFSNSTNMSGLQSSFLGKFSQESFGSIPALFQNAVQHLAIQPNADLQRSSSKNNLVGLALRENVDGEQRRSAQKNFTGKDQRNMSPYAAAAAVGLGNGSAVKLNSSLLLGELNSSAAKAKRQISFDS